MASGPHELQAQHEEHQVPQDTLLPIARTLCEAERGEDGIACALAHVREATDASVAWFYVLRQDDERGAPIFVRHSAAHAPEREPPPLILDRRELPPSIRSLLVQSGASGVPGGSTSWTHETDRRVSPVLVHNQLAGVIGVQWERPITRRLWRETRALLYAVAELLTGCLLRQEAQARRQQIQKLESLGQLAGGLGHDLNNLVVAIAANAHIASGELERSSPDLQLIRDTLTDLLLASQRAEDFIGQMLSYSGRATPRLQRLDINTIARRALQMVRASFDHVAPIFTAGAVLPHLLADAIELERVVVNLLCNAAQASAKDSRVELVTGFAELSMAQLQLAAIVAPNASPGPHVVISVRDEGRGIPPDVLPRIFDPFFTTRDEGKGLGLANVVAITRNHNGALFVRSTPGHGTIFNLLIPCEEPDARDEGLAEVSEATASVWALDEELPLDPMVLYLSTTPAPPRLEAWASVACLSVMPFRRGVGAIEALELRILRPALIVLGTLSPEDALDELLTTLRILTPTTPIVVIGESPARVVSNLHVVPPQPVEALIARLDRLREGLSLPAPLTPV